MKPAGVETSKRSMGVNARAPRNGKPPNRWRGKTAQMAKAKLRSSGYG
jgi:hypothetical protein